MFVKGQIVQPGPGRPQGRQNKVTVEVKQLAKRLVSDKTYQRNLQKRLRAGDAGAMEVMLWHYSYGKPKESIDLNWNLEKLTDRELDQLEAIVKRVS